MNYLNIFSNHLDVLPSTITLKIGEEMGKIQGGKHSEIYCFSRATLNIYCSAKLEEKAILFPLAAEICILYDWVKEIDVDEVIEKIDEKYFPLISSVFFRDRNRAGLENLEERAKSVENPDLRKRINLSCNLFSKHLNRDFNEEYAENALEFIEHIKDINFSDYSRDMIIILQNYLYFLSYIGNQEQFYKELKALETINSLGKDPFITISFLYTQGVDLFRTGKYSEAQDIFSKSLEISREISFDNGVHIMLSNKAICEYVTGHIHDSIKSFEAILEQAKTDFQKFRSFANLGEAHLFAGNLERAEYYLNNSLELERKLELHFPDLYSFSALLFIYKNDRWQAKEFLYKCEEKLRKSTVKQSVAIYYYIRGLYFLILEKDKDNAKNLFEESLQIAVDNNIFEYILKNEIHLAVLALEEFADERDLKAYTQVLYRLDNVLLLTEEQSLPNVIIEAQILKHAAFKLSKREEEAKNVLSQAKKMSEEANLEFYTKLLSVISSNEQELITSSLSRIRKMKLIQITKKAESRIEALLVSNYETGTILYENIVNKEINFTVLITGLITAVGIRDESLLGSESTLSTINFENKIILLERIETILLILIIDQDSYIARTRIHTLANKLKESFGAEYIRRISKSYEINIDTSLVSLIQEVFPELY